MKMGNWLLMCCEPGKFDTENEGRGAVLKQGTEKKQSSYDGKRQEPSTPKMIMLSEPQYAQGAFEQKYTMKKQIGTGSTSVCHLCVNKATNQELACKIVDRRLAHGRNETLIEQFRVEIKVLQALDHPNIIHLEDVYQTDSKIIMVTELMRGGELFDYIVEKGALSEKEASSIVRRVTSALAYMHECGIVHRDLKPENLLLTKKGQGAEVKIIDFGLAKLLHDTETRTFLGTRGYLAPEMLRREAYSKTVDVWALGVIVYVILCGCLPFDDDGSKIVNEETARVKFSLRFPKWASGLSESAKDLLQHLLEVDMNKRYSARQALNHPWVSGQRTPDKPLQSPKHLRELRRNTPKKAKKTCQPSTTFTRTDRLDSEEDHLQPINQRRKSR